MASTVSEILSECLLLLLSSATLSLPLTSIVCARLLLYGSQAHDNSSLTRQTVSMQKAGSRMVSHLHSTRLLIGGKVLPKSRSNRRCRFTAEMPIAIAVRQFTTPDKSPTWIFSSARLRTGVLLVSGPGESGGRVDPHTRVGTFLSQLSPYFMPNPLSSALHTLAVICPPRYPEPF